MKAAVYEGAKTIRVEDVPDPRVERPTDAVVRIERAAVCGSDLWTYRGSGAGPGTRIGHEFVGTVEAVGDDVSSVKPGDWVIVPFRYSCGTCRFCRRGLQSSCLYGGFWGRECADAGQGEFARIPYADGTLVKALPDGSRPEPELIPSLLTLSDVFPTGYHAAACSGIKPGDTVVVIGDGAVGLNAILASRMLGAGRVINAGSSHADRNALAKRFGADDIVSVRGEQAQAAIEELTHGCLADVTLECVGASDSFDLALQIVAPGGTVSYVGLPHGVEVTMARLFARNVTITGGICPARAYIPCLLPLVLDGAVRPGDVLTGRYAFADLPLAYADMDERRTVKALIDVAGPAGLRGSVVAASAGEGTER